MPSRESDYIGRLLQYLNRIFQVSCCLLNCTLCNIPQTNDRQLFPHAGGMRLWLFMDFLQDNVFPASYPKLRLTSPCHDPISWALVPTHVPDRDRHFHGIVWLDLKMSLLVPVVVGATLFLDDTRLIMDGLCDWKQSSLFTLSVGSNDLGLVSILRCTWLLAAFIAPMLPFDFLSVAM